MNITMKRKNKGFTLLEIIIVVIIVGVLASLALPRLFGTVEFSRSTEAMATIGGIRQAMERCALRTGIYTSCVSFAAGALDDIPNPDNEAGAHFKYTFPSPTATMYNIHAVRTTLDSGTTAAIIDVTVDVTAKTIVKKGATAFNNL